MKTTTLVCAVLAVSTIGAVLWFNHTFTVMETLSGGEYLVMRSKQAEDCKSQRGCAIFSEREFLQGVAELLRPRPGSGA